MILHYNINLGRLFLTIVIQSLKFYARRKIVFK